MLTYLSWPPVIVLAVMAALALLARKPSSGFFLTVVSTPLALFTAFIVVMMECANPSAASCPTDNERRIAVLAVLLGTLLANIFMWFAIINAMRREDSAR